MVETDRSAAPLRAAGPLRPTGQSTLVVVAFGHRTIDLSWVPAHAPVVVVHNDDSLAELVCASPFLTHVRPGRNLGFGAGVNAALPHVRTERVVLANPDMAVTAAHWSLLDDGGADDVITVPQQDLTGTPNSVVNRYFSAAGLLASAWRVGRWMPRGSRRRALAARCLGSRGAAHVDLLTSSQTSRQEVVLSLADHWVSGSLFSVDSERLRAVGGFSEQYFLYYEDVDLCAKLGTRYPRMRIRLRCEAGPAMHAVGGSARSAGTRLVRSIRRRSAHTYARGQAGTGWTACSLVLSMTSLPTRPGRTS
ncbi:GT2 family glycosyltransferase [Kineococcus xinjiangensis]|uniref:GT2 family glycosyltransferase n=1 Tax=Kineococcus xinjiangensis TaxID=512762 RepID=A0A2S6II41_9ACTN|nr:hypothetical protein [Kineococcus xinjiangensis]PPK93892.1 GT2 family glycosyltransferase [Kineococcus xinjiangensis]